MTPSVRMQASAQRHILEQWLESHQGLLFKVVRAYAVDEHDREDLFQEVVIQLWRSIPSFRGDSAVSTWIYRVAVFCGIAWTRKERQRPATVQPDSEWSGLLIRQPEESDPRIEWLYEQIQRMELVDRSLTLMMLDGLPHREIAGALGITENLVGVKLHRIRAWLSQRAKEANQDAI
ncbi:MAG TPA: sigma-70 family RNA polymerase sigma factor [Planctomycetota bacterium]|nr:sigma-70 family RNA polymerase sigma factor [Planctomycetota bacterium]HRV83045.1 sigma-70 family RNA polymerase sigma factor [Planctomycetota bacterium]